MKKCGVPDTIENSETFDWIDSGGKPVRVYVKLEGEFRSQINAVAITWRPIHKHLGLRLLVLNCLDLFSHNCENIRHFLVS